MAESKPINLDREGVYPYKNRTVNFSPGDIELLDWITEFLGCSQADAIRSAVRAFAVHLKSIERSRTT